MTIVVVCLFLWRMSYGMENGLFAEAAGLIAVIAAFFAVYYSINLVNNIITVNLGNVLPKIGYLVVAFAVYKIMTALADALRRIKNIPIISNNEYTTINIPLTIANVTADANGVNINDIPINNVIIAKINIIIQFISLFSFTIIASFILFILQK